MNANMPNFHPYRIWRLCLACGQRIYSTDVAVPAPKAAYNTACLLFGTAAQESHLVWERQRSPQWEGVVGAFSKWQLELGSIRRSLGDLIKNPLLCDLATQFVFEDPRAPINAITQMSVETILWAMRMNDNDTIGALFARLHYLRVPERIPSSIPEQAHYWKKFYNTEAGKGTVEQYIKNWHRYTESIASEISREGCF